MIFKKIVFWLHLIIGVITGVIILIMSVTGVALTYQKQMTAWADKKACKINSPADAVRLSSESLIEAFQKERPGISSFNMTIYSDASMPVGISVTRDETLFINPYTGEYLGAGSESMRSFFSTMTNWHRWLALSGESRVKGKAVTGACNLAFLFIAVSGIYLWWPSSWTWKALRITVWFRAGLSAKARDFNWHHVFGLWCLIPLIFIILSAVVISYPWATGLLYRLSGSQISFSAGPPKMPSAKPPFAPSARMSGGESEAQQVSLNIAGLNKMLDKIVQSAGTWKTIGFQVPASGKEVSFSVDKGWGGQPHLRTTVTIDTATGDIIRTNQYKDMDSGLRARMWMRFVHTGEYYGLTGQTIAGIASIGGVILVWTGIALSFRRYAGWMKRRALK